MSAISCAIYNLVLTFIQSFVKDCKRLIELAMLPVMKHIKSIFGRALHAKLCALMIDSANQLFFTSEKKAVNRFIAAIYNEYAY